MSPNNVPRDRPGPADRPNPEDRHVPVLAERVDELLAPALVGDGPVLVDATLGLGGHTLALLDGHPTLTVLGIDRDPAAIAHASRRVAAAGQAARLTAVHGVYDRIGDVAASALAGRARGQVDAVLFDLGVSSMQLDRSDRGFAYSVDAPLDMRMDPSVGSTAAQILRDYDEASLARILADYGEERFAGRIARAIVAYRRRAPLTSSAELVELVRDAIPAAARRTGGHPAKRTFQALRIEVNDELGTLRRDVPAALRLLRPGGRIVVLAYQSLEDRIVKRTIAPLTVGATPLDLPVELPGHGPSFRWVTRGAGRAGDAESAANPRAKAARLRAAERVTAERAGDERWGDPQ
jgi:16S rRNA (cytosine1402-N4)-methyltransferase